LERVAPAPNKRATSDADGRYRFDELTAGTYRVAASKSGYAPLKESDIVLRGLPMLGAGPSVTLDEDQKRENVDVTLALGSVSGFVFDELDDPIQGATIQVLRVRFERGRPAPRADRNGADYGRSRPLPDLRSRAGLISRRRVGRCVDDVRWQGDGSDQIPKPMPRWRAGDRSRVRAGEAGARVGSIAARWEMLRSRVSARRALSFV
jgi:hypothetical protein